MAGADVDTVGSLDLAYAFPSQPSRRFVLTDRGRRAVPAYCPACFAQDAWVGRDNHFRHEWALAGVGHCQVHRVTLQARCHHCWSDLEGRWRATEDRIVLFCRSCGASLSSPEPRLEARWPDRHLRTAVQDVERMIIGVMRRKSKRQARWVRDDTQMLDLIEELGHFIYWEAPGEGR